MNSRKPTKAEEIYLNAIRQNGCLACAKLGYDIDTPPEYLAIHHATEIGSKDKYAHFFASCLCPFHHQGIKPYGVEVRDDEPIRHPINAPKVSFKKLIGTDIALAGQSWAELPLSVLEQIEEKSGISSFSDLLEKHTASKV